MGQARRCGHVKIPLNDLVTIAIVRRGFEVGDGQQLFGWDSHRRFSRYEPTTSYSFNMPSSAFHDDRAHAGAVDFLDGGSHYRYWRAALEVLAGRRTASSSITQSTITSASAKRVNGCDRSAGGLRRQLLLPATLMPDPDHSAVEEAARNLK